MKLWSGRFTKDGSKLADDFNTSLPFDIKMYKQDILGSIAHATMLNSVGILKDSEYSSIVETLQEIGVDIASGKLEIDNSEDIHMFIEAELTKRIGETGKKLHTARSRNDQVATDLRLYSMQSIIKLQDLLLDLIKELIKISEANLNTVMPGFTHMQKAQPVTLAHHMMAYAEMFNRDLERLTSTYERTSSLPLGSCALAGTSHPINRDKVAELLGFSKVARNSMDAVSDRDFVAEYIFDCSLIMMHLSRSCEEIITWASDEYKFINIDDSYATGSSIMPQKKNPDMAELIRGKVGRVYGSMITILTVMKGLPLAYNKDMQEDKECLFDAEETVISCLKVYTGMLQNITFNEEKMLVSAKQGFTNATDVADYLVEQGVAFRTAHEITGKLVLKAIQTGRLLEELTLEEFNSYTYNKLIFKKDIYVRLQPQTIVSLKKSKGGPAPSSVQINIKELKDYLFTDENE